MFAGVCIFTLGCACLANAQTPATDIPALLTPEEDKIERSLRERRNKRFNLRTPYSMIEPDAADSVPFTRYAFAQQPELPLNEADTVVLGEVIQRQPFLSADRKGIYTEYTLRIIEVIKAAQSFLVSGESITLARAGGEARLADGQVVRHRIVNDITPSIGKQYLLFLVSRSDLGYHDYLKIWAIQDNLLTPLFPDDIARTSAGQTDVGGKSVSEIVKRLRLILQR